MIAPCQPHRRGIARREVAVLVLLSGLALLLLFPWMAQRRAQVNRDQCERRQMKLAQALLEAEDTNEFFPGYRLLQAVDAQGERRAASWVFATLPYLNYDEKSKSTPYVYLAERYGAAGPDKTRGKPPSEYIPGLVCPENVPPDRSANPDWMSYVVNCGLPDAEPQDDFPPDWPANGVFLDRFREPVRDGFPYITTLDYVEQHDGAEYTLLLSENVDSGRWTDTRERLVGFVWVAETTPEDRPTRGKRLLAVNEHRGQGDGTLKFARPSSYHMGGVNVAYADGRTEFLNQEVSYVVLVRAMTPDDTGLKWPGSDRPIGPPYERTPTDAATGGP